MRKTKLNSILQVNQQSQKTKCKHIKFEPKFKGEGCKYLGIIIRSDLSCPDQVNYTVQKGWRARHFVMRIVKEGIKNTKILAYTSLLRPTL